MIRKPTTNAPLLVLAALTPLVGVTASAQTDRPADQAPDRASDQAGFNPALRYWSAWNSMDADRLATVRDWDFEKSPTPTFEVSVALADLQPEIIQIVEAAEADGCDWGIDWTQGWETLLPHLGNLRRSCQLLRADARRLAAAGMTDDSVRRVEAVFEIAADSCENPVLISSLVGIACAALGVGEVEHMIDAETLTESGRARLLAALRSVETDFGIVESVERERGIVDGWFREKYQGEEAAKQLAEYMLHWPDQDVPDKIAGMTPEELRASVARALAAYDDIVAMWDAENAKDLLAEFEQRVEAGEYGVIAQCFLPSAGVIHDNQTKIKGQIRAAIENLEAYEPSGAAPKETGEL